MSSRLGSTTATTLRDTIFKFVEGETLPYRESVKTQSD